MVTVSVCVPTYNAGDHFRPCLESIAAQTFADFEVVICDDGSTDGTYEAALDFAAGDPRFVVHRNASNLGLPGNWDAAIELSRGDWIKLMFQDDLMDPDCLETMVAAGRSGRPFVVCDRVVLNETTSDAIDRYVLQYNPGSAFDGALDVDQQRYARALLDLGVQNFIGEPTCTLFRREAYEAVGRFDGDLAQFVDLDYWNRLGLGYGLARVPRPLVTFRFHESNASNDHRPDRAFRATVLDKLQVLAKFEVDPQYQVYRDVRSESGRAAGGRDDLGRHLPDIRGEAWRLDRKTRGGASAVSQLRAVLSRYPELVRWERERVSAGRRFVRVYVPPRRTAGYVKRRLMRMAGVGRRHRVAIDLRGEGVGHR